jgi:hypothetical protein
MIFLLDVYYVPIHISLKLPNGFWNGFLIDRVIKEGFYKDAWWSSGQCPQRAIVEAKQLSYRSVIGWVTKKFIISSSSVLRKARLAVGPGCICSR